MNDMLEYALRELSACQTVQELDLPPELARTRYPLGALELVCRNWKTEGLAKIYAMRMKVRIPWLDIIGMAFHPQPRYDLPLFMFDLSCTKKKVISYINVLAVFPDEAYREKYMLPFEQISARHADFHPFKMPEWMQMYRSGATIYADPGPESLDELKVCVREYAAQYFRLLGTSQEETDPARIAAISRFHETFKHDLITKDRSQIMLSKVIGKEKAGRIFREVLT